MSKKFVCVALLIALSLLLLMPVAGCKTEEPAGAEINVGLMGGLTGPAASSVVPMMDEAGDIFRYINEVEGGIDGVKLNWRVVDNKGTPDGAVMAYKELRDTFDPVIYLAVEDYYLLGIQDTITSDKSVLITWSAIDPRCYIPPQSFFSISIPVADGFAGYIKWLLDQWEGPGQPKVGVLYWEDVPTGEQWRLAEGWVRGQGVELVLAPYSIATLELKPQLMALRDAGVDHIWMLGISPNVAVAIRDFRSLGLTNEIPFCFSEYTEPKGVLGIAGEGAEGFYGYRSESPYSDGTEAARLYSQIWQWSTGEDKWADNRLMITMKAVLTSAVKQAIEDVGRDNLSNEAVYNAMNKLTEIDTWGNQEGFGYGPDRRVGVSTIKIHRYTKDGTVSASDWIELPRIFEGKEQ